MRVGKAFTKHRGQAAQKRAERATSHASQAAGRLKPRASKCSQSHKRASQQPTKTIFAQIPEWWLRPRLETLQREEARKRTDSPAKHRKCKRQPHDSSFRRRTNMFLKYYTKERRNISLCMRGLPEVRSPSNDSDMFRGLLCVYFHSSTASVFA